MKIAVLAGNHAQFKDFLVNSDFVHLDDFETFVYIDSTDKIRGYRFDGLIVYGTWYERKDINDITEYLLNNLKLC